ncbi:hypothetical protein PM082_018417 [Marasmius tenuissimus]|nr:hypothetical protein PM082_018417 [Marasmius tenuissimus]
MVEPMETFGLLRRLKVNSATWKRNNEKKSRSFAPNLTKDVYGGNIYGGEESLSSKSYFETVEEWLTPDRMAEIENGWRRKKSALTGSNGTPSAH